MEELLFRRLLSYLPARAVIPHGTLSAVPSGDGDGEDRVSALPDDLLRIVVSRLPIKDAARTAVLSPRWRRIWRSAPLILYDAHLLPASEPARAAAIDRILAVHPGPIRTVHLAYCFLAVHERELARWPRRLAAGGVRDLVFLNLTAAMNLQPLPADILRCAELRRLYLGFWMFPNTVDLPDGAGDFPHLRELVMLNTFVEDSSLDRILASSPALKKLALVVSYGQQKHVRLRGQKLQCVLFWQSQAAELAVLDAPCLERLILWETTAPSDGGDTAAMVVKIAEPASALKVLGYLDLGAHKLQIGNTVIKADTNVNPTLMVPSVKNLALKVNLGVFEEVKMLASILRSFPNIETLHLEPAVALDPTGNNDYAEFFMELSPIECMQSHIRMVVLHGISGDLSEVAFLMYLSQRAYELQKLTLVLVDRTPATVDDVKYILQVLALTPWASERCMVSLVHPKLEHGLNFHRAYDLAVDDPFLEHGRECFRFTKEGYRMV